MPDIPKNRYVVNDLMVFSAEELAEHALNLAKEIREGASRFQGCRKDMNSSKSTKKRGAAEQADSERTALRGASDL